MSELPHARFAKQPLLAIVVSLSAGILLFKYLNNPKLALALTAVGISCLGFAIRIYKRAALVAVASLLFSSLCAGYLLASLEARAVSADRLVSLIDRGALHTNEPLELTGELNGEPETSPDGFYLKVRAEQLRSHDRDRPVSGTVILLAHVADQFVKAGYDR